MVSQVQAAALPSGHADILGALRSASAATGSDFDYLLGTALRESSLKPEAKAKTSSATGLFQFIDQTWLGLVKQYGDRFGLAGYAQNIQQTADGRFTVASPEMKAAILALRKDPKVSALMAGQAAEQSKTALENTLGRPVNCGELYAAHFLGQGGACRLLALNDSNSGQRADLAFPQAANANRGVFYHADGTPKTVGEVYAWTVDLPETQTTPAGPKTAEPKPSTTDSAYSFGAGFARAARGPDAPCDPAPAYANFNVLNWATPPGAWGDDSVTGYSAVSQAPFVLTPGVVEILASLNAGNAASSKRSD